MHIPFLANFFAKSQSASKVRGQLSSVKRRPAARRGLAFEALEDRRVFDANQAPVNWIPAAQSVDENSSLTFATWQGNQVSISDPDAGSNEVQVYLYAPNGTLTLNDIPEITYNLGYYSGYSEVEILGSIDAINSALDGLIYTPNGGYSGDDYLQITTDDLGNSGDGGSLSATDYVSIHVNYLGGNNEAPSIDVPGYQSVDQYSSLTFASWNGNQISVSDPDAGSNAVLATMSVSYGTLNLNGESGLSFSNGGAYGNSYLQFYGTIDDINTALDGMYYSPYGWFTGDDYLQISIDDLGNSGAGGSMSSNAEVGISVYSTTYENQAPSISVPDYQSVDEYSSLIFASWNGNQIYVSDPDAGSAAVYVGLSVSYGSIYLNSDTGLSFSNGGAYGYSTLNFYGTIDDINAALDGMTYSPNGWFTGDDYLQISIDDLGNSGDGGSKSSYAEVAINVYAYQPVEIVLPSPTLLPAPAAVPFGG